MTDELRKAAELVIGMDGAKDGDGRLIPLSGFEASAIILARHVLSQPAPYLVVDDGKITPDAMELFREKQGNSMVMSQPDGGMREANFKTTPRGFALKEFTDRYGAQFSIQKSSLATEDCIWFGLDGDPRKHPATGEYLGQRMHLTRDMVAELIPILQLFANTGELPTPTASHPVKEG